MKVKELIENLEKFNPEMEVLGEFDMDGDQFMVKVFIDEVYKGNGLDDGGGGDEELENTEFCIIKLDI
jgi:hypothetical protein|tara:strand:+ start:322 stop:525 length:204 start_codon:yes stop_codon:yes gene_type:complete